MTRTMAVVELVDRGAGQKPWFRIAPADRRLDYYTLDMDHFESRFASGHYVRALPCDVCGTQCIERGGSVICPQCPDMTGPFGSPISERMVSL